MRNNRVQFIKRVLIAIPFILSVTAVVLSVITLVQVADINRRLRSVSLNSYVEQTLVSNNYIVNQEEPSEAEGTDNVIIFGTGVPAPDREEDDGDGRIRVFLTFDDGPSTNTSEILDILKKHNVKATFFVNGPASGVPELEPLYKRITDEGNAIGMHSYSHKYDEIYSSAEAFETDLDKIHSLIYNETGIDTKLYRFPGGSGNTVSRLPMEIFAEVLHDRGYEYYDWNIYPGDRTGRSFPKDVIVSGVLGNIDDYRSAIVLLHDSDNHDSTVEALPEIVEGLLERDVEFCVIDDTTPVIQQVTY
ncbi:MAG: polysaccharide deacetylase [Lachnospiraceae bacterium]|nr:polysaccharide deacetylase [Lachnospiraceae bacterium]